MKLIWILMTLGLSFSSQAGTLSENVTEAMLAELLVHNGYAEINIYNVRDFNLGKRISDIKDENSKSGCEYRLKVSRKLVIDSMKKMGDIKAASVIENLYKKGLLKTAIVNQTDSDSENIEFCNSTDLEIYSNDGEVLRIIYDHTT